MSLHAEVVGYRSLGNARGVVGVRSVLGHYYYVLNNDAGVGIGMLVGPSEGCLGGWEEFL